MGRCGLFRLGGAAFVVLAVRLAAAEQAVEFVRDDFAVGLQVVQQCAGLRVAHAARQPVEVGIGRGQQVSLLVIQILDAMFHTAQKGVGGGQRLSLHLADDVAQRGVGVG